MEVSDEHKSIHSVRNMGYTDPRGVHELGWTKNYNLIYTNLT
jgi:hypothetical protein